MKHLSKVLGIAMLFFSLSACQDSSLDIVEKTGNKHSAARTSTDLVVTTPTILAAGNYGTVEVKNGGALYVIDPGATSIATLINSTNHIYRMEIEVWAGAKLVVLNCDLGNAYINNSGTIEFSNMQSHFAGAQINNHGLIESHAATGIAWYAGKMYNYGTVNIESFYTSFTTPYLDLRGGEWHMASCSYMFVNSLRVNAANVLRGQGRIRVGFENILNANLTTSPDIRICPKSTPYPSRLGSAVTDCILTTCP